jgi:hypothetical protein
MKMVKSLILGSAAGLVAMSGAQAADLPVKAKAVEYVRICSLYGAGFYYIPGTDTCIKLSGYLRTDVLANSNAVNIGNTTAPAGYGNRYTNAYSWRSREDFDIDTRTATEYGVVRTYMDAVFTWDTDSYTTNGANALGTVYSQLGTTGVGAPSNAAAGAVAKGTLGIYYAFIQFAGFTMGKAISPFSAPWTAYPGNSSFDGLVGGGGTVTGVNQFVYTAQFGNGVSGTIGVQDPTQYYQAGVLNFGFQGTPGVANTATAATGVNDYAGTVAPDVIGVLNVTQAWGMAQLSVAAHDNNVAYYVNSASAAFGHPEDKWGFAVQGALSIANIPTGPGDTINVQGVYTNGATRYNIQDLAAGAGAWTTFAGTNVGGALGSVGIGVAPDSVFANGGSQQLISTWGGRGAFNHNWNPYWSTSIYGAYASVNYGGSAASIFCSSVQAAQAAVGNAAGITSCNPNYSITQAGIVTRWTPVKNLTFSGEFTWEHLSQNMTGVYATTGSYGAGAYAFADQNTYQMLFRAQRNW